MVFFLDTLFIFSKNSSCAKYPSVYDIHFNNIYWQQTDTSNGTFFLYGAYLDVRLAALYQYWEQDQ